MGCTFDKFEHDIPKDPSWKAFVFLDCLTCSESTGLERLAAEGGGGMPFRCPNYLECLTEDARGWSFLFRVDVAGNQSVSESISVSGKTPSGTRVQMLEPLCYNVVLAMGLYVASVERRRKVKIAALPTCRPRDGRAKSPMMP